MHIIDHISTDNLTVTIDDRFDRYDLGNKTFWIQSNFSNEQLARTKEILSSLDLSQTDNNSIKKVLDSIKGNFAIICCEGEHLLAFVDKIRSFPLFYSEANNKVTISTNAKLSAQELSLSNSREGHLTISMGGYTIGNQTLFEGLSALRAGEFVLLDQNFKRDYYYFFRPWLVNTDKTAKDFLEELSSITLSLVKEIHDKHKDKTIVIPLSAGFDSRLIVSAFKEIDAKNIICVSYGQENNFEAQTAKLIADKLGYPWKFVELNRDVYSKFQESDTYIKYKDEIDSCVAVPFFQDICALSLLKENNDVPSDAVFINGNSGDFISGAHIIDGLKDKEQIDFSNIIDILTTKHFALWKGLLSKKNKETLSKLITEDLDYINSIDTSEKKEWAQFEAFEFLNRQSKYVISGQWNYDFFGFNWELPLWSEEYLLFWEKVPYSLKRKQKLYKKFALSNNWGGVWSDIPINKKDINSLKIRAARFIVKALCAPFGKSFWHSMEKRVFAYHMEILGLHGKRSYWELFLEKDEPRNILSWLTRDYLNEKTTDN